jgi:hypothetical protein
MPKQLGVVAHACNLSDSGSGGGRIVIQASQKKKLKTLSEKQSKSKMNGGCSSCGRILVKQVPDPEFNPQYHQNNFKIKKINKMPKYRLNIPYLKCLGPEVLHIFEFSDLEIFA